MGSRTSGKLDTDTVTELSCYSNCVSKQLSIYTSQIPGTLAFIWPHVCDNPADLSQIFVLCSVFEFSKQLLYKKKKIPKRNKNLAVSWFSLHISLRFVVGQAAEGRLKGTYTDCQLVVIRPALQRNLHII